MKSKADFRPWTAVLVLLLLAAGYLSLRPELLLFDTLELPIFAGLVVLGAMAIAIWSGIRQDKRVIRLARVAEAMMDGDYSARCPEEGNDALTSLARSLNQLAERTGESVDQLRTSEERIRQLAYRDSLTGLPNRRMLQEMFTRELDAARRYDHGLAFAILDVDNLKDINDSLGHAAGDGLLVGITQRLGKQLRSSDVLARVGGDEFALLMRTRGRRELILPALSRLLQEVREPFEIDGREVRSSLSIGLSLFPEDGSTPQDLMSNADFALYRAKAEGRNAVRRFDRSMNELATRRIETEQDLRRAMDGDEFFLWYQPIIRLKDCGLAGMESLLRWQHPRHGLVLPSEFIALAEQAGLLPQIGRRVLLKACQRAARWQARASAPLPVSVNVSVRQVQTGGFVSAVANALEIADLPPHCLKLEITENVAAEERKVLDDLAELRNWGVQLVIDDFGTGYSSFSSLLKNRIDCVKIDRSFVAGIPDDPDSAAIVRAILSLARSFGVVVVAEGIENGRQLDFLVEHGCTQGQGFLLHRPAPASQLDDLVEARRILSPDAVGSVDVPPASAPREDRTMGDRGGAGSAPIEPVERDSIA